VPTYVSDTAAQTPEHSKTSVVALLHSVMVSLPLQTAADAVHGGKQDAHHDGGVAAEKSAQVSCSSICWHDEEITRAPIAP
jgi:hypothetical protein